MCWTCFSLVLGCGSAGAVQELLWFPSSQKKSGVCTPRLLRDMDLTTWRSLQKSSPEPAKRADRNQVSEQLMSSFSKIILLNPKKRRVNKDKYSDRLLSIWKLSRDLRVGFCISLYQIKFSFKKKPIDIVYILF